MTDTSAYRKFRCRYCGFLYDEAEGMPDDGIAPGTRWEDISEDWICPQCGSPKDEFDLLDD